MKKTCCLFILLLLLCSVVEAKKKHFKSFAILLRPSHESLILQNQKINLMGLVRIGDEKELSEMVAQGRLSPLPVTNALRVNPSLPQGRRYVTSFVPPFLLVLSDQFYAQFGVSCHGHRRAK